MQLRTARELDPGERFGCRQWNQVRLRGSVALGSGPFGTSPTFFVVPPSRPSLIP